MTTEKELAQKEIEAFVEQAYKALGEAEKLAEKHKLNFYFDPGGHGTYFGNPDEGEQENGDYNEYGGIGWSSSHC